MSEKPTAAFVVSLIGGILILLGAIAVMVLMSAIGGLIVGAGGSSSLVTIYGVVGIIFSLIVLLGAVMLYMKPQQHRMWGVLVLLFSLFSIISGGGFLLGLILGLVGGILGIIWKPPMMQPGMMQQPMPPSMPPQ